MNAPYRVAEPIPPKEYDVERPYFPRVGDVVRVCHEKLLQPLRLFVPTWHGSIGIVQMISVDGIYFVAFPELPKWKQAQGAAFFNIVELEEYRP